MKHDAVGKLDDPALWANSLSSQRPSVEERRDIERLRLCGRTHGAIAAALYGPDGHRLIACIADAPNGQLLVRAYGRSSSVTSAEKVHQRHFSSPRSTPRCTCCSIRTVWTTTSYAVSTNTFTTLQRETSTLPWRWPG